MAVSLASISSAAITRAPRILLLGERKIGKSCFASGYTFDDDGNVTGKGVNNPVVIPIAREEGVDDLQVPKTPTVKTYGGLLEWIGALYADDHDHRTVVIDSMSALEPLVWKSVCDDHQADGIDQKPLGYGRGYVESADRFRRVLEGLDALRETKNMASILIGHVKIKRFDDPSGDSYDRYFFDVHERVAHLIERWADVILFAAKKVAVVQEDVGFNKTKKRGVDATGDRRYLFTKGTPAHPGGGRGVYGHLPYELPLNYSAFTAAVANAMESR